MIRPAAILTLALLCGCMKSEDEFLIRVEGAPAENAVLYLDDNGGRELLPVEGGFRGTREIRRDSSGVIIVYFRGRPPVVCHVGYTTNGLSQVWRFWIDATHEYCHGVDKGAVVSHDRSQAKR
jgi:hypothetical protein